MVGFSNATTCALLLHLAILFYLPTPAVSLSFNYSTFTTADRKDIKIEDDASLQGDESGGYIDMSVNIYGSICRAWYNAQPVQLWDKATGEVASFTTGFEFDMYGDNSSKAGIAFFLAGHPSLPADCPAYSLGLTNQSADAMASGDSRFVAVEFDTFNNTIVSDPNASYDHIGINVNSLRSVRTLFLPISTLSNENVDDAAAVIKYDNVSSVLAVTLRVGLYQYNLSSKVDLKSALPDKVSIGFSASSSINGYGSRTLWLSSWYFNSSLEPRPAAAAPPPPPHSPPRPAPPLHSPPRPTPPPSPPHSPPGPSFGVIAGAAIGVAMFLVLLLAAAAALVIRRRYRRQKIMETEEYYTDSEGEDEPMTEIEMGTGPRRFPYHELVEATRNFTAEEKLGQGGFGTVYRGYLRGEPAGLAVAIKRFSNSKHEESSMQGKSEYKSEIKVISRLRHRNLVQLLGWCHGREELLLVYELMPNRSLDIHLHGKQGTFLTWPMRMKILLELGSALLYLHDEWEQGVLHRDIKPSNVMLDESFGAKLGDFGLARLVDHAAGMQTMTAISGNPGYLDPECVNTGRASAESDVYSFGVVLLEVACGKRPMSITAADQDKQKNGEVFRLVEWAWRLYGQGVILEAADERLNGDYNAAEVERVMVVELWCAHPNPSARPSIRTALAMLQPKVDQANQLPVFPSKMSVPMFEPSPPLAWANVVGMSWSSSHTVGVSSSTSSSMPPHTSCTTSSDASTSTTRLKTSSSLLKHQYP